ncbi:MAG: immunity 17 family protein [Cyanobacteria bacterium P01_A01_bin.17]
MGWVAIACGVFSICGAVTDWDWFMNNRRARLFVRLLGRTGARLFYGLLGSCLIILGVLLTTGIIESR